MLYRRLLLSALVIIALILTLHPAKAGIFDPPPGAVSQFFEPADKSCPPNDGWDWQRTDAVPADRVEWLVIENITRFEQYCRQPDGDMPIACARIGGMPDIVYGGTYGTIYAPSPAWLYGNDVHQHEWCHTQGWNHRRIRAQFIDERRYPLR